MFIGVTITVSFMYAENLKPSTISHYLKQTPPKLNIHDIKTHKIYIKT